MVPFCVPFHRAPGQQNRRCPPPLTKKTPAAPTPPGWQAPFLQSVPPHPIQSSTDGRPGLVAFEGRCLSVFGPVGFEGDLRHGPNLCPFGGDELCAFGAAAVQKDHVGILGSDLVERGSGCGKTRMSAGAGLGHRQDKVASRRFVPPRRFRSHQPAHGP